MKRYYTAEAVTEGHPDKLCDLIADSILDACLKEDPESRVACEVLATKGNILVAGEITSRHEPSVFGIIRNVMDDVGYSTEGIEMDALIHQQSPDIAGAVSSSKEKRYGLSVNQEEFSSGAGDQGIMIGYACSETPQLMPMPVVLAQRIVRELSACRKSSYIKGILPDGKAQVTVEYEDGIPVRIESVVVSCQHEEEKSLKKLDHEIREKVLKPALRPLPPDEDTKIFINPSGCFVCGGLDADTGLTGRKLMVDSYGSLVPHGGGAFSGKDCSKVDRSAAYMARYIAKNMVAAGLASRCQVSLAYAIEYLRKYESGRLKKSSARNEWELTDHDSFKINGITSKWHWKSRDIGGVSALRFLTKVDGMEFTEAVRLLCGENPCYIPMEHETKEKKPFVLPEQAPNCGRIRKYLNNRGVSDEVMNYCIQRGILYESLPYHNAVFVGKDEQGKARYAFLRGIYDYNGKIFRIEQVGSEKAYSFCVPPSQPTVRAALYEASVDALAHMTLEQGRADQKGIRRRISDH